MIKKITIFCLLLLFSFSNIIMDGIQTIASITLLIIFLYNHIQTGVKNIYDDYLHNKKQQKISQILLELALILSLKIIFLSLLT